MGTGKIISNSNGKKARRPKQVIVSDGTLGYPYGHPEHFSNNQPDGLLLLDLGNNEYSEFRLDTDRDCTVRLYNHMDGSRYKLFVYRTTMEDLTISFSGEGQTVLIEGSKDGSQELSVVNVEVAGLQGKTVNKIIDNIDDSGVSQKTTWSSEKISAGLEGSNNSLQDLDRRHSEALSTVNGRVDGIEETMSTDAERLEDVTALTGAFKEADEGLEDRLTAALAGKSDKAHGHGDIQQRITNEVETLNRAIENNKSGLIAANIAQLFSVTGQRALGISATVLHYDESDHGSTSAKLRKIVYQGNTLEDAAWRDLDNWGAIPIAAGLREKFIDPPSGVLAVLEDESNWVNYSNRFEYHGDIEEDLGLYPGQEILGSEYLFKVLGSTIVRLKKAKDKAVKNVQNNTTATDPGPITYNVGYGDSKVIINIVQIDTRLYSYPEKVSIQMPPAGVMKNKDIVIIYRSIAEGAGTVVELLASGTDNIMGVSRAELQPGMLYSLVSDGTDKYYI